MSSKEHIKTMNDYEVCGMLLMTYIEKGIEECIADGIDQYTIPCGSGYYKEYKQEFIKDIIIPKLTIHTDKDSEYSTYKNGYYYYKNDCMCPYEIEYDGKDTMCFNRVETDDEVSEESEGEEDEWNNDPQCFGEITDINGNVIKNPTKLAEWFAGEYEEISAKEFIELMKNSNCDCDYS